MELTVGHLYMSRQLKYLYLMPDNDSLALVFTPDDPGCYSYIGRSTLTSEFLTRVTYEFQLFWKLSGGLCNSRNWKLSLILGEQIPQGGLEFLDMDRVLEYIMIQQEDSYLPWSEDDFNFLGSFHFKEGRVHYNSCGEDKTIFEEKKILNRKEVNEQV